MSATRYPQKIAAGDRGIGLWATWCPRGSIGEQKVCAACIVRSNCGQFRTTRAESDPHPASCSEKKKSEYRENFNNDGVERIVDISEKMRTSQAVFNTFGLISISDGGSHPASSPPTNNIWLDDVTFTIPDGLALDTEGRIWIGCHRPDAIYIFDLTSKRLQVFAEDWMGEMLRDPSDVAFAGPNLDVLLAASLGNEVVQRLDNTGVRGLRLNHPKSS